MLRHGPPDTAVSWSGLQEALAEAPALVAVTHGRWHRLAYANAAYRRVFDPAAHAGSGRADAAPGLLDTVLSGPLDDVFRTGHPYAGPTTSADPGGHFRFTYTALRDSTGQVSGILIVGVRSGENSQPAPRRRVQADPPHQPDELQVAVRYVPTAAQADGGDWYDVIALGAGRTALVIGDVLGRGPHAREVTRQLRSALRAYARLDLPPAEILGLLDALVSELHPVQIATCLYASFDPVDSLLTYSTAGHPAPLVRHPDGTVERLTARPGAPLGVLGGPFPSQQTPMPAGSVLLLYTDGLVDNLGHRLEVGIAAVAAAISGPALPLEELADNLLQLGPADVAERVDDVALLLARSSPATNAGFPERSMRLPLNSGEEPARRARAYANGVLSAWKLPQTLRDDIVVVVGELVANAVLHSGLAQELRLRRTSHRVVLEVLDRSPRAPRPRPADPEAESGRGMHMVAQLADRWGVRPLDGGKSVWCEFLA